MAREDTNERRDWKIDTREEGASSERFDERRQGPRSLEESETASDRARRERAWWERPSDWI